MTGYFNVGRARAGVAARVVVDANDSAGSIANRFPEDFSWMNQAVAGRSGSDFAGTNEAVFSIEAKGPELFDFKSNCLRAHEFEYAFRRIEDGVDVVGARQDASADLNYGHQLESLYFSDAFEFPEFVVVPSDESGERSCFGQKASGDVEDIVAFAAAANEHGQEFYVAERRCAQTLETFLGTLGLRELHEFRIRIHWLG